MRWGSRYTKYEKLKIALKRLSFEQDIQNLISLNRVSRLVHKANFLARQRRAVNFSRKFVISNVDIQIERDAADSASVLAEDRTITASTESVLRGFDPYNLEVDRRLLYETTG